jgi:hypothetical protein
MTLFELYEARKTRFKPGTIWRDERGICVVKALKIVDEDDLSKYSNIDLDENSDYGHSGKKIYFEIIDSSASNRGYDILTTGKVLCWFQSYIERYYVPLLK